MKFKSGLIFFLALMLESTGPAWAQPTLDNPDWAESEVPPPPAFDVNKLIPVDVSSNASLIYGIDPATIHISTSDGLVRYVMVASSATGARNVMYEGIRCSTGEFKTYARYSPNGHWNPVANPQWRSMFDNMPSKHALRLAQAGICDGRTPTPSVNAMIARLKNPFSRLD